MEILEIIKDRPARICVGLSLALNEDTIDREFKRRDVFEEHAPVVVELESPLKWFHDRLMQKIISAIEA